MTEVFIAFKNSDMTEGRGPMVVDGVFALKSVANQYIDKQPGCMGRRFKWSQEPYGDWEVKPYTVIESLAEIERIKLDEVRRRARSKLTPEEAKALGLE